MMSKNLTITNIQENKELKITEENIKLSLNVDENLNTGFGLIEFLYSNPNKLTEVKEQYSNEILKISKSQGIGVGIQNTIQLFTILNESMLGAKLVEYNKDLRLEDLFEYNNPIILIGIIAGLSKQKINNSSKNNILSSYLLHASEDDIYKLLLTLEKLDESNVLFEQFIKELVSFTVRHIESNIIKKERKEKNIEVSKLFYGEKFTLGEYDYNQRLSSAGEYVDLEQFVKGVDENFFPTTDYSDEIDDIYGTLEDGLRYKELDDIFEGIQEDSPMYNLLMVIKINYTSIYNKIILELQNFSYNSNGNINTHISLATSRLLNSIINDCIGEGKIEETRKKTIRFLLGKSNYSSGTSENVIRLITGTSSQDDDDNEDNLFIDGEL